MKKTFLIIVLFLLSFSFILSSCKNHSKEDLLWKLIVLNQEVSTLQVQEISGEICVPLVPVLLAYGYEVQWQNDELALIKKDKKQYFLDLSSKALYEEGKDNSNVNNIIYGIEGGKEVSIEIDKDILLCVPLVSTALHRLGENSKTDTVRKEHIVYIGCTPEQK